MTGTLFGQTKALVYRNFLLKKRNLLQTSQEIFHSFYFMLILVILALVFPTTTYPPYSDYDPTPIKYSFFFFTFFFFFLFFFLYSSINHFFFSSLFNFSSISSTWSTLGYAPNTPQIEEIMNYVQNLTEAPELMAFQTSEEINEYVMRNPGILFGAVIFDVDENENISPSNPSYSIRFNSSFVPSTSSKLGSPWYCRGGSICPSTQYLDNGFIFLQDAINKALVLNIFGLTTPINATVQQFPKPAFIYTNSVMATLSAIYVVLGSIFFTFFFQKPSIFFFYSFKT